MFLYCTKKFSSAGNEKSFKCFYFIFAGNTDSLSFKRVDSIYLEITLMYMRGKILGENLRF